MTDEGPLKVLIVEDEVLVAMFIEDVVAGLGFGVVGPAMRLPKALKLAVEESFHVAVLDVNLANEQSFPVAHVLRQRGIPFIFATGYGSKGLIDDFKGARILQKPFEPHELERALGDALAAG